VRGEGQTREKLRERCDAPVPVSYLERNGPPEPESRGRARSLRTLRTRRDVAVVRVDVRGDVHVLAGVFEARRIVLRSQTFVTRRPGVVPVDLLLLVPSGVGRRCFGAGAALERLAVVLPATTVTARG
jgi:hypothetical protein